MKNLVTLSNWLINHFTAAIQNKNFINKKKKKNESLFEIENVQIQIGRQ